MTNLEQNNTEVSIKPTETKLDFLTLLNPTINRLPVSRTCLTINGIHVPLEHVAAVRDNPAGHIIITMKGFELTLIYQYEFSRKQTIALMKEAWHRRSEILRFREWN